MGAGQAAEASEFFARCAGGFERQLAAELRSLGIKRIRPLKGGVAFFSDVEGALRACLWSRVASRILMVLGRIDASDADALYQGVQSIDWTRHIPPGATIAVFAQGTNEALRNTQFIALRAKDAVCDQLRAARGARPDVKAHRPDIALDITVRDAKARVMLDLSGEALHRRGYREEGKQAAAPLKETLAAAIVLASGWEAEAKAGAAFVDPMCGSGTLVIEAAMAAADMAPGILRDYWGFTGWAGHDPLLWDRLLEEADLRLAEGLRHMPPIIGCDIDEAALGLAKANARRAGLAPHIRFFQQDVSCLSRLIGDIGRQGDGSLVPPGKTGEPSPCQVQEGRPLASRPASPLSGLIVTNPPYGERLSTPTALPSLYKALATGIDGLEGPWALSVITPDAGIDRVLGQAPFATTAFYNGGIETSLRQYRIDTSPPSLIEVPDPATGERRPLAVKEKNSGQFASRLGKVAKERRKWAQREGISCYRVYDADLPDYAVAIDLFKGAGASAGKTYLTIAEYAPPKTIDEGRAVRRFNDVLAIAPLVLGIPADQVFPKTRKHEKGGGQYRGGEARAYRACIEEGGFRFELDLGTRLDPGIFLDHRITRRMVGEMARGARFLNLFAYTGTASVYAAGAGAASTTTVDLSQTYLAWAKRNMGMNGFSGPQHRFVRADALEWLDEESASGEGFDLVFVDPPTFSNSKAMGKSTWSVQRDHVGLLVKVARVLGPGGKAVFSCNLRSFKPETEALREKGLDLVDITSKTIPEDFKRSPKIHHCFILSQR